MPWDVATAMPDEVRLGWVVAVGTYNGQNFDWEQGAFRTPQT